jgi:putative FmdB family regulatory protein
LRRVERLMALDPPLLTVAGDAEMPLYEYVCNDCGERVTILSKSYDQPAAPRCPVCDGENLKRLLSRVAITREEQERLRDLSWMDRDIKRRVEKKARNDSLLG